ncbi:tubulin monoglycylase TTLL3-like isoform X2 [Denticeps clupeoides]|uniref:Tubulin monoglycylase TTLL3-like n=1 Tax=Denticeps clupeoides TaxID=299321 RepID=A0AAY4BIL2_9TELE|nr:tubulin monoglycylase TTLL3-like isoform X2 [Denticeps clupeoides]
MTVQTEENHLPPSATSAAPPTEAKVRRSALSLPVINLDRHRTAKALVDNAVKMRKVFSIQGPYPVVRSALRDRGWVERRLPRPPRLRHRDADDDDGNDEDDSGYDDVDGPEDVEKDEPNDLHDLMSRMVRNEMPFFFWTTRRDTVDTRLLKKEQMTNHFAKAGTFTTKVGLCVNLRNLRWFDAADPDTFFPRCYRLGAEDEKHAFIEDFRRTACSSLLQCVVERGRGECGAGEESASLESTEPEQQAQKKAWKRQGMVSSKIIESALKVCQDFLDSLDHSDIDISSEALPALTERRWSELVHAYYLAVHDGAEVESSAQYVDRCQAMLHKLRQVSPQLDTDGIHNIWIIKPGAMSRGRGIICSKRLDEILRLVDGDPSLIKDSKWVAQKYLERPLLVHGTKFDLRQWFLVTDWNPLTVWFYDKCYVRFSTQPYTVETMDSAVHLCNNSIQKHFQPSQQRHPELPQDNIWSCGRFRAYLSERGQAAEWAGAALPGMKAAVVRALQTAQDLVESRRGSFELYGADFMLGPDLRPWLIEINASPTMAPSTAVTARLCAAVQEDTLRVVLDRRLDRNANTGGFQLIYKQAAVDVPQYLGVNLLIEGCQIRRPCARKSSAAAEPHVVHPASVRPQRKQKDVGAAKKKTPPKRWIKAVVRQLTLSTSRVQPSAVPRRPVQAMETWRLPGQLTAVPAQNLPRSLDVSWQKPGARPGPARPGAEGRRGPVLPLEVIGLQDSERDSNVLSRSPIVPQTGQRLQNFSRHHQRRTIRAGRGMNNI